MTPSRRHFLVWLAGAFTVPARAEELTSRPTAYSFSFKALEGGDIALSAYAGKPILVVNVASLCGYTPQYTGLQQLWARYRPQGLMIIGVPSNDFYQEPGSVADIKETAHRFQVDFPLTQKESVMGATAHPFYRWARLQKPLDPPRWNFHKYLVSSGGHVAAAFSTAIEPLDPRVIDAIEKELAKKA